MKLAEMIAVLATSKTALNWALDFSQKLGKELILVNESPGFIVNRMLAPMIYEAVGILAEGVVLADLIGNDVTIFIMENLYSETGDPECRVHPLLRKMVRANRLGCKVGKLFSITDGSRFEQCLLLPFPPGPLSQKKRPMPFAM